jgi:hypothetical protein
VLRDAGRRCQRDLRCHVRAAGDAEADLAGCQADAEARFAEALASLSARKSECADESAAAALAAPAAHAAGEAVAADVIAAADPATRPGLKLHKSLLSGLAGLCAKTLAAHGKQARAPDDARLAAALTRARERFVRKSSKALERAAALGVVYSGPLPPALADALAALAADLASSLEPAQAVN